MPTLCLSNIEFDKPVVSSRILLSCGGLGYLMRGLYLLLGLGYLVAMRDRFVPPSYHRDLRKKLMRLEQGDKSVQD